MSLELIIPFAGCFRAGPGASIGPADLLLVFRKKKTRTGVFAGILSGAITVFIWKSLPELNGLMYELIPALLISLLITYFVSIGTYKK